MSGRRQTPVPDLAVVSGARVRQRREQLGHSVNALAKAVGVSPSLLSRWERGVGDPSLSHAVAIARVLGLSLDALVREDPHEA